MSPIHQTVRQLKLHVRLHAPGPGERFAVLGSHEALGCWNPTSGLHLEWKGSAWETPDPISISPCARVEFKFVRVWLGDIEWETGPNRVTEFPNFKGDLCLQGIFNGESILQPDDYHEVPVQQTSEEESIHHEEEFWKRHYEETLSVLTALQKDIASRHEEQERRRAQHQQVVNELRQQIRAAENEEGLEKELHLQSNLAPETGAIPSPSFASPGSLQSTPAKSVGKSSTSSMRRNTSLHFKSQRMEFQGKTSQGPKASAFSPAVPAIAAIAAPAPPRGPIGRLSSVLETMAKAPGAEIPRSSRGTQSSKSETALAALRAARGASPVSPPSEDETLQSPQPSGAQSTHEMRTWSRSESGLRGSRGKYERVSSTGAEAEALDEGVHTVIASKEVVAALATAKARYDEAESREDSR